MKANPDSSRIIVVEISEVSEHVPVLRVGREYFRTHPNANHKDQLILHNVRNTPVTPDDYARLNKKYEGTLSLNNVYIEIQSTFGKSTVDAVILAHARHVKPSLLIVGMGKNLPRRAQVGSVAHRVIHNITHHVYVVRSSFAPKGTGKKYLICLDGSAVSLPSVHSLLTLVGSHDELVVVTISYHNGAKDQSILSEAKRVLSEAPSDEDPTKLMEWKHPIQTMYRPRDREMNLGEQICKLSDELRVDVIACAPGARGMTNLGSVSSYIVNHAPVDVMVLKEVTTVSSE